MLYKLEIIGFRGITRTIELGRNTLISGGNGLGKTNAIDAIRWCFTGVDGEDKTNNNIFNNLRAPDDKKEKVCVRSYFVDGDGVETSFARIATRKGDKVEYAYAYGEVEVSAKKYAEIVENALLPIPQLKFILNVRRWDLLDASVLRKALLELNDAGDSLICDEAYKEIKDKIEAVGVEDTKKQFRKDMRDGQKSLDTIQVELNLVEQGVPEYIEAGDLKKRLEERTAELNRLEETPSEMPAELREKVQAEARHIAELESQYEAEQQKHHLDYTMRLQELRSNYGQATEDKRSLERLKAGKECEQAVIDTSRQKLQELRDEYDELAKRVFEGTCPCCGRPYEGASREEKEAEWRIKKDEMIASVKARAKRIKDDAEAAKERVAEYERKIAEIKETDTGALLYEIKRLESEGEKPFAESNRGKELHGMIEKAKSERTDVGDYDKERLNGIESLRNEIFELKIRFAESEDLKKKREEGLAKVAEIKERQAQVVKRVSASERLLALTNRYEIALLQGLQDYLNDILNAGADTDTCISLYYTDESGEAHSQCKIISNGVSETINNAQRSLIGLRLAEALIRKSGKDIPVLIDNVEAFDRNHRPTSDFQLIMSKVDEDGKEFKVEIIQ